MSQPLLVTCPHCRIQLQLPPSGQMIQCFRCGTTFPVTRPMEAQARRVIPPNIPIENSAFVMAPSMTPPTPSAPSLDRGQATHRPQGRKKALLVGIVYRGSPSRLRGCINDVKMVRYMLEQRFHWDPNCIVTLTEDMPYHMHPTKANIERYMHWLVADAQPGDSLLFHYSGHGSHYRSRDEVDGYAEVLVPVDSNINGHVDDKFINRTLVNPLPPGVTLHAIIDACHSGSVMNLPWMVDSGYKLRTGQYRWIPEPSHVYTGTRGGVVLCISGCSDSQTSEETSSQLTSNVNAGALTFAFIQSVEDSCRSGQGKSYASLMDSILHYLKNGALSKPHRQQSQQQLGLFGNVLMAALGGNAQPVVRGGLQQNPQISCNQMFDMNAPFAL